MDCYCEHMRATPEGRAILAEENIPDGYCGLCEGVGDGPKCGKPGHVRPYPGPVPCTGSWCDECYTAEGEYYLAHRDEDTEGDSEEDDQV